MTPRRPLLLPATAAAAALVLVGCSGGASAPMENEERLSIVAVTDVYGDIATRIGGDLVAVESLVSGTARDPHSFEATVQDRLAIAEADVVIVNGGGYDDFMTVLLEASDGEAVVIDAVETSGLPGAGEDGFNEHVWYDFGAMRRVAETLAGALAELDPAQAATFRANADAFAADLDTLSAQAADLAAISSGTGVVVTEPVPLYLLEACGLEDLTPPEFSEAVEEGADVPPVLLSDVIALVASGRVALFAYNAQTAGTETQRVLAAAEAAGVPVVSFTETLPDGEDYVSWMTANLEAIAAALR